MARALEDDRDAGVLGAVGDLLRVCARSDPHGHGRVAKVVDAERADTGGGDGGVPVAPAEEAGPDRVPYG